LVVIAEVNQQIVCFLERHSKVAELLDVFRQFVEDQVGMSVDFFGELVLLGLHEVLNLAKSFAKE